MAFFQATGLLGTINNIAGVLISIRRCYKAQRRMPKLITEALSSLENIKQIAPKISRFVEVGGIGLPEFCVIAGKIIKIEVELLNMGGKLEKMNKIHRLIRFCSAPESASNLGSICGKLTQMETEMRLLIASLTSDVKVSVLLETLRPFLAVAEEFMPHMEGLKKNQQLLADTRKAFGTHMLAARMNRLITRSTESVYYLIMGKMFFEGIAVEVDYGKSASFFNIAISYGNSEAFAYLGRQYSAGLGMRKDQIKAVELYMDGAEQKDACCLYEMGKCYAFGSGVEKNKVMSFDYCQKAANLGHVRGQRQLAYYLSMGRGTDVDRVKASKYYKSAAEAGDEVALCYYGRCMLYGNGLERNAKVAVKLLKIAAHAGSVYALVILGDCYYNGLGLKKDLEEAFRLYSEAAKGGNLLGLGRVGRCLAIGAGVPKNESRGVKYLRKAAANGSHSALNILAGLYQNGIGGEENKKKALVSYQRSIDAGHWPSNLNIGEMYRKGEGTPVNMKKAIRHFKVLAKYENNESHFNLACIYREEEGYVNDNRALYHFRLAADLGHRRARDVVGEYFVNVSVSGPRRLSFTNNELQLFVQKITTQYSRKNSNARTILASQGLHSMETFDRELSDFTNHRAELPSSQPAVTQYSNSVLEPAGDITPPETGLDASILEIMSHRYPYWWLLPFGFFNILTSILIAYLFG